MTPEQPPKAAGVTSLSNDELREAIAYTSIRVRQVTDGEPQQGKMLAHLEQLLSAQAERARTAPSAPTDSAKAPPGEFDDLAQALAMTVDNSARANAVYADRYHELLMAVECKTPGESRHESALRYIREREQSRHGTAQSAAKV